MQKGFKALSSLLQNNIVSNVNIGSPMNQTDPPPNAAVSSPTVSVHIETAGDSSDEDALQEMEDANINGEEESNGGGDEQDSDGSGEMQESEEGQDNMSGLEEGQIESDDETATGLVPLKERGP